MDSESSLQPYEKLYTFEVAGDLGGVAFPKDYLGCWVEGPNSYMFFTSDQEEAVERLLAERGMTLRSKTEMDYSDWESGRRVKHIRVGNFVVCPTWDIVEPGPGDLRIILEPGVSFGTGWHQTTNACIDLLQLIFREHKPKTILDIGTGTGILSVAALLLGAERTTGIDYDMVSLTNARKNFEINGLADRVKLIYGDATAHIGDPADLVIANVYFGLFDRLFATPGMDAYPRYLFSGILSEFVDPFLEKVGAAGIRIIETRSDYGWYTFYGEK